MLVLAPSMLVPTFVAPSINAPTIARAVVPMMGSDEYDYRMEKFMKDKPDLDLSYSAAAARIEKATTASDVSANMKGASTTLNVYKEVMLRIKDVSHAAAQTLD